VKKAQGFTLGFPLRFVSQLLIYYCTAPSFDGTVPPFGATGGISGGDTIRFFSISSNSSASALLFLSFKKSLSF